ncbi:hypothetical protein HN747_01835 [archaeon]|jgi:hypothetical protein|nr:hypothetical protein [archaeon]
MVKSKNNSAKLQKINVLSAANIVALIYFVLAPIYFLVTLANSYLIAGTWDITFLDGLMRLVMALIVLPLSAWISVSVFSLLYNVFAKRTGGVEIVLG